MLNKYQREGGREGIAVSPGAAGPGATSQAQGNIRCHAGKPSDGVTHQGSWPPLSIEIDYRSAKKFRQGFAGAPTAAGGGVNK